MVVVEVAEGLQEIDDARLGLPPPGCEGRVGFAAGSQSFFLEAGAVSDDRAALAEVRFEPSQDLWTRVAGILGEEGMVHGLCARFAYDVQRELERYLFVRAGQVPDWDSRVDGFEVEEVKRVLEPFQEFPKSITVHLRVPTVDGADLDTLGS